MQMPLAIPRNPDHLPELTTAWHVSIQTKSKNSLTSVWIFTEMHRFSLQLLT